MDGIDDFTRRSPDEPYIFEVWRRQGHTVGTQRQDYGVLQIARFPVMWRFMTTFGTFLIVSNEEEITRQMAIDFAKAFAFGKIVHYRVDLKDIGR